MPSLMILERDAAANRFNLFRNVNHAAAALTDLLEQFVAPNPVPGLFDDRNNDVDLLAR